MERQQQPKLAGPLRREVRRSTSEVLLQLELEVFLEVLPRTLVVTVSVGRIGQKC
jgi:hypothetical protein